MKKYFNLLNIKKNTLFEKEIEYLIKYKFFYKNKISTFYPILIPQNDTENMVNVYNNIIRKEKKTYIYELGYGSNNINASIKLKNLNNINIDNNFLCFLTKKEKINKTHILGDWLFIINSFKKSKSIITNPPYIGKKEIYKNIENTLIKNNLISNKNGLNSIYNIIKTSKNILLKNGTLMAEHCYNQDKQIRYFSKLNGFKPYTFKDHNNIKRFIYLEI
ncbi:MAG TPA: class I SAM-dependent methyltransferase [Candidatus Azoamicus sp.]